MTTAEKLTTIAENQQRVYDAGYEKGKDGYYDAFWDFYQNNGNRRAYVGAFCGEWSGAGWWNDTTFRPKYDIIITGDMRYTFAYNQITDLKGILEEQGVTLDTSGVTAMVNPFLWTHISRLPVLDLSSSGSVNLYCAYKLKSVDKIILKQNGTQNFDLRECGSLEDIVFEGVIGRDFNPTHSTKLTKASIENIFSVLSDTATGKTATFSATAVEAAFTAEEWDALVATRPNWTIAKA